MSISQFVMSSKGKTLERLQTIVKDAKILDQVRYTVANWQKAKDGLISEIQDTFSYQSLIVRSSSIAEDSFMESKAGYFESILNVDSSSRSTIADAVERVIFSFGDDIDVDRDEMLTSNLW